jgi:uncharacterized protein (TIGR02118 family)
MIKFTAFMKRHPGMSQEEFVAYHRDQHGPLFKSLPASQKHVRRYVQSHPAREQIPGLTPSSFDGLTEIWFDDIAGFEAVFTDAEYMRTIRPDEQKFLDLETSQVMLTREHVVMG